MRYIDLDLLVGDATAQTLIDASDAATVALLGLSPGDRKKHIEDNRARWVAFRSEFQRLFGNKCWYTESRNPGTDDDIDHFRPKGRLADDAAHGGYWWEALNWRNFRLSCHRGNRLRENPDTGKTHGKGDHFPLLDEARRAKAPDDDLTAESPALLDPTNPADPPLLTFDIDGTVSVAPTYEADPNAVRRVEDSRIYLHLDWPAIKEERQSLYRDIYVTVLEGDKANAQFMQGNVPAREQLKAIARRLIRAAGNDQPYTRAAQTYVWHFRDRSWLKAYVLPHIPNPAL